MLACLGEGESFGEMALLSRAPRSATAVAVEETDLWRIARDDFERLIARSPALRQAVEELQTQRLLENLRTAGEGEAARWHEAALAGIRQRVSRSVQAVGLRGHREGLPIAIYLGALLDGIPASLAIGAAFTGLATLHVGALVAVFAAGLPEAMSSAAGMRAAGVGARRIFGLWGGLLAGRTAAGAAGNAFLFAAPATAITFIEALAGGGVLAVLATLMMPEAYEEGGPSVGLATIAGFLCTFFFAVLALH